MNTRMIVAAFLVTQAAWAGTYSVKATTKGFEPSKIEVPPGDDVTLLVTRNTDATCATEVVVPSKKLKVDLPLNKEVKVHLGKLAQGEIKFACAMKMMSGVVLVK